MAGSLTILGCGSSGGVPRIGNNWGLCDPENPRNRRRRCSILLRLAAAGGETQVLIDTSPDLRDQMLSTGTDALDAVLFTHEHADHTHGIDELRAFYLRQRHLIPIWADEKTASLLVSRFGYCFITAPGSDYPPILRLNRITAGEPVEIVGKGGAIRALPFVVHHGNIDALGFRVGNMAYTPDVNAIPEASLAALSGLDLWVVDALRPVPHPSHFSLPETLAWIERLKPKRAVLTNMHIDLDFATLKRELPPYIEPAYDGMILPF
ncbi:MBL fold metallo-hydrolase [Taklimakanibacter lacteus]|uniref:MBL fold metallo-hydrolase n=1 Tax=Taklimakanibacter lacteus TaxID=2268456 RepID=UPI000E66F609